MAKFEKGNPGGGRPKGSKDKRTLQWQTFSEYCLNGGLERFEQELNSLEGKQFVDAFLTLLEYHKPKLSRAEVKHEGNMSIQWNEVKTYEGSDKAD